LGPSRDMVSAGDNMQQRGWVSRFRLAVFDRSPHPVYGRQLFVGEARDPHRIWVSKDKPADSSWTPKINFWAFSQDVGDCVMISVACSASPPSRCKFEIGRRIGNAPEDKDWKEHLEFWVKSGSFI